MQKKRHSIIESGTNIVTGMIISFITQLTAIPAMGIEITMMQQVKLLMVFTLVSLIRTYAIRRFFNNLTRKQYEL